MSYIPLAEKLADKRRKKKDSGIVGTPEDVVTPDYKDMSGKDIGAEAHKTFRAPEEVRGQPPQQPPRPPMQERKVGVQTQVTAVGAKNAAQGTSDKSMWYQEAQDVIEKRDKKIQENLSGFQQDFEKNVQSRQQIIQDQAAQRKLLIQDRQNVYENAIITSLNRASMGIEAREEAKRQITGQLSKMALVDNKIKSYKVRVNPRRFLQSRSPYQKRLMSESIGMIASAGGDVGPALNLLNQSIEQDIDAQKTNIRLDLEQLGEEKDAEETILKEMKEVIDDDVIAEEATRAAYKEKIAYDLERSAFLLGQSDTQANLMLASEQMNQEAMKSKMEVMKMMADSGAKKFTQTMSLKEAQFEEQRLDLEKRRAQTEQFKSMLEMQEIQEKKRELVDETIGTEDFSEAQKAFYEKNPITFVDKSQRKTWYEYQEKSNAEVKSGAKLLHLLKSYYSLGLKTRAGSKLAIGKKTQADRMKEEAKRMETVLISSIRKQVGDSGNLGENEAERYKEALGIDAAFKAITKDNQNAHIAKIEKQLQSLLDLRSQSYLTKIKGANNKQTKEIALQEMTTQFLSEGEKGVDEAEAYIKGLTRKKKKGKK